jgi:hypothetical protein
MGSGITYTIVIMNNLENLGTSEMDEPDMKRTNGGFGLLLIAFNLGLALAYYEVRIKAN